jgi:ketosteroid isomerase-like protein
MMILRTLFAAALICCSVGVLCADDRPTDTEARAIHRANEIFYAALNAMFDGDLQPMTKIWSHAADVTYLGPDGSFRVGWEATLKDWQKQAAMKLGGKVEPQEIHITVGRDLAIAHNYEVGDNVIDGKPTKVRIRATNLYRKEGGEWKMIGHHTDLLPFLDN